jgi:hypothetical protein
VHDSLESFDWCHERILRCVTDARQQPEGGPAAALALRWI